MHISTPTSGSVKYSLTQMSLIRYRQNKHQTVEETVKGCLEGWSVVCASVVFHSTNSWIEGGTMCNQFKEYSLLGGSKHEAVSLF